MTATLSTTTGIVDGGGVSAIGFTSGTVTTSGAGGSRSPLPTFTTVISTSPLPGSINPICCAAAYDRSMVRPPMYGPRSLMRTRTLCPVFGLETSHTVPNGSDRCAAVNSSGSKISPFAVVRPANSCPYQLATPCNCCDVVGCGFGAVAQPATTTMLNATRIRLTPAPPHALHHQVLSHHERQLAPDVRGDDVLVHDEAAGDVVVQQRDRVGSEERFRDGDPPIRRVVQRALEPLRRRGHRRIQCVDDQVSRQAVNALRAHRIALVGHRR